MRINVAIVEDNTVLRKRLQQELELFPDVAIVGAFATGSAALQKLKSWPPSKMPHLFLMDIELPGMSGIETTEAIKREYPDIDIMMITVFEDQQRIFQSIQAGATGYLLKDASPDEVIEAIRELREGGAPMSRAIARKVLAVMREPVNVRLQAETARKSDLSEREVELLHALVAGESYTTIAKKFFISPHTVRTHIKNIYKKLHVHSRATAVKAAIERKLV